MSKVPPYVCWVDLETTRTDENAPGAFMLEVGFVITDHALNEITSGSQVCNPVLPTSVRGYIDENDIGGFVAPVQEALESVFSFMDPYVQNMHTVNGLWAEVVASQYDTRDLDEWFADAMAEVSRDEKGHKEFALAGSGVGHFDSRWIKKWLPNSQKHLTYWPYDMGSIRRFLANIAEVDASGADPQGLSAGDAKTHRALDDARAHLEEGRFYRDLFKKLAA